MHLAAFHSTGSSPSIRSKTSIGRLKIRWQADVSNRSFDSEPERRRECPEFKVSTRLSRAIATYVNIPQRRLIFIREYAKLTVRISARTRRPGQKLAMLRY